MLCATFSVGCETLILVILSVILLSSSMNKSPHAQGWRGLVPMKSSCADVKRVLPTATCKGADEEFDLGSERVRISYSEYPCYKAFEDSWNIPVGTVILIERSLTPPILFSSLHLNVSKCDSFTFHGSLYYGCKKKGLELTTSNGYVSQINYVPTPKDERLRCPKPANPKPNP